MIRNLSRNTILARDEFWAISAFSRFRGLIGHDFSRFDGMVFPNCNAIHTFFMGMDIDVIFADRSGTVLEVYSCVRPWKFCLIKMGANITIELPAGSIKRTETEKGDILRLENMEYSAILSHAERKMKDF